MTGRERVLTAMRRRVPDMVPKTFALCPSQMDRFRAETGATSPADYFGFETRSVGLRGSRQQTDFSRWLGDTRGMRVDEWGVGWQTTPDSMHFEKMIHPLRNAATAAEVQAYPFPDLDAEYRYEGVREETLDLQRRGFAVTASATPLGGTIFWPPYKLRGMEQLLMDLSDESPVAEALIARVTDISSAMATRLASCGVDIVSLADDLGTQNGLFVSKEMFRRWFRGPLARVVESAKRANPDVLVFMHSDGDVTDLIPDFIDIGIDILNPLQPECMDVEAIKSHYRDDLAFWGGVGTQTTMPFGTPEDVRDCVRSRIEVIGRDGGFLIAPTHLVEPEVPWENIMAFVEAVEQFGAY